MLGFHRARPEAPAAAPASSSTSSSQKERRSHAREDDLKRMLAFLPICAPNPLPVDFTYHLPGDRPTTAHHDPYLLGEALASCVSIIAEFRLTTRIDLLQPTTVLRLSNT